MTLRAVHFVPWPLSARIWTFVKYWIVANVHQVRQTLM